MASENDDGDDVGIRVRSPETHFHYNDRVDQDVNKRTSRLVSLATTAALLLGGGGIGATAMLAVNALDLLKKPDPPVVQDTDTDTTITLELESPEGD